MATWQQVKNYVYANYQVSNDTGEMLTLNFQTEGGRSQMITMSHVDAGELSSILFGSPVASSQEVSADRVLRATESSFMGVRSVGDYFVVTHTQLLATVDEGEIDMPLALLTRQADAMEKQLGLGDRF